MDSQSESYRAAGVDITSGYRAVELMKGHIARTATEGVFSGIGGFGGMFRPDLSGMSRPVFVSGTDGVGTKLKLAFLSGRHDTVGVDAVAMCVNDIICSGAKPLFFLDYIATGRLLPEIAAAIVKGVADGCVAAGAALIGGETAEMPGFYADGEYDVAGFAVGVVDERAIIAPDRVREKDVIVGIASSGFHSNGFSLIRKVFDDAGTDLFAYCPELRERLIDALLTPTKIYVRPVLELTRSVEVHGLSHITGGGFFENIPRCLPAGFFAKIEKDAVRRPPVFDLLRQTGHIPERDMFNTFNMGVGMIAVVAGEDADRAVSLLAREGETAYVIGEVAAGGEGVRLC